jgi:hypothetical protein
VPGQLIAPAAPIGEEQWQALCDHGGFPEPFLRRDPRFSRRWRSLRQDQLAREDLRDVAHVQDLGTMETLMAILAERSGHQLVYATLARDINVSVDTVKRWIDLLSRLHYGFTIRPWFRNVTKALRKEPKWYLRDKAKREVDFLVVRDRKPWFLVEAKQSDTALSAALGHFQAQTQAAHAFQVVMDLPFEPTDCFASSRPSVVPARTLLSQLL